MLHGVTAASDVKSREVHRATPVLLHRTLKLFFTYPNCGAILFSYIIRRVFSQGIAFETVTELCAGAATRQCVTRR